MTLILSGTDGLSDIDGSAATPAIRGTDTNTGIFFPAADTIAFSEGGVEAMRIDSSGNVGIGTSSPSGSLDIGGATPTIRIAPSTTTNNALLRCVNAGGTAYIGLDSSAAGLSSAYALNLYHSGAYPIDFTTNGIFRARIDSSGNLLVNTTSNPGTSAKFVVSGNSDGTFNPMTVVQEAAGSTSRTSIQFYRNSAATAVGTITTTNAATAYNTSSDYRLKEQVQPMTGALARVTALKPVTYKWKVDGSSGEGFIAHELAEVVPQCVTGEKDAVDAEGKPVYQGIDTSFLVATLTAAIQEQQAIIQSLTARIEALEGK